MKPRFLWGIVLVLLALDWAALHDIAKGSELDYTGEYTTLLASLPVFGFVLMATIRKLQKRH